MGLTVVLAVLLIKINFALTASTSLQTTEESRIIGGQQAKPHSHPYLVSLQTRLFFLRFHVCGGSLINERWAQISPVDLRVEHPLYEGGIGPHDIAVLRLQNPFTLTDQVQPIHLPYNNKISNEDPLILAGWGVLKTTIFIPDLPNGLQEVKVKYLPFEECRKAVDKIKDAYEYNPLNKDSNICTGPISGGVAACSGDSGGPLIQMVPKNKMDHRVEDSGLIYDDVHDDNKNDESPGHNEDDNNIENVVDNVADNTVIEDEEEEKIPVVRGVVSWGMSPCGDRGAPTVYTKISQYIDFIKAHTKF